MSICFPPSPSYPRGFPNLLARIRVPVHSRPPRFMKQFTNRIRSIFSTPVSFSALLAAMMAIDTRACTIFVLTDSEHTLFCNNEDWSDPKTRIWFVPGNNEHYGGVYLGFDNNFAQGGMNTKGLAFDWVAGYS